MTQQITIPFGSIIHQENSPVYYRACSGKMAWRKLPTTGAASHNSLDSAVYGVKGAIELFGNHAFARERRSTYGEPRFVAVWSEDSHWAFLVKERVAAIIPKSSLYEFEEINRKDAKQAVVVDRVTERLAYFHDHACSHVILDKLDKLTMWTGEIGIRV